MVVPRRCVLNRARAAPRAPCVTARPTRALDRRSRAAHLLGSTALEMDGMDIDDDAGVDIITRIKALAGQGVDADIVQYLLDEQLASQSQMRQRPATRRDGSPTDVKPDLAALRRAAPAVRPVAATPDIKPNLADLRRTPSTPRAASPPRQPFFGSGAAFGGSAARGPTPAPAAAAPQAAPTPAPPKPATPAPAPAPRAQTPLGRAPSSSDIRPDDMLARRRAMAEAAERRLAAAKSESQSQSQS